MKNWFIPIALCAASVIPAYAASKNLEVYFIDVEGGQSTLFISPSGQSLLIDTGWPGNNGRDADRIAAVAKQAGLKKIDYLLITHFHTDHVGGVPQLATRIPIGTYIDHGTSVEHGKDEDALFKAYLDTRANSPHILAKPGDTIPLKGVKVQVLSAAGDEITQPLPGAGEPNTLCGSEEKRPVDETENARSVGTLITFGKFRALDLGDLTWNKEMDLVCPVNRVGKVDVYIVSHHGMNMSGSKTSVHAFAPRVAIMDNGAHKGGTAEAYQAIKSSPGLEDIWQLHYAVAGGDANNANEKYLANVEGGEDKGYGIKLTVHPNGSFQVTNQRTGVSQDYDARR
jgi:beta-lactamase superfamily II metal-dependent hydrolase